MDLPSKRKLGLLFGAGFIFALLEPLILLALGDDLGEHFGQWQSVLWSGLIS